MTGCQPSEASLLLLADNLAQILPYRDIGITTYDDHGTDIHLPLGREDAPVAPPSRLE